MSFGTFCTSLEIFGDEGRKVRRCVGCVGVGVAEMMLSCVISLSSHVVSACTKHILIKHSAAAYLWHRQFLFVV